MTRTKHTDPAPIRAARRLADPAAPRGADDLAGTRRQARLLKQMGIVLPQIEAATDDRRLSTAPRIHGSKPTPGFLHPLGVSEIRRTLDFLGPIASYGLRTISLRRRPEAAGAIHLAAYRTPDSIVLYEQRSSPWILPGALDERTVAWLEGAGARVEPGATVTRVSWPGPSLARLMRFDGLCHELGHHLAQRYDGKPATRTKRTADHERRADAFARACRQAWPDAAG